MPVQPYPATLEVKRRVSASALVAFQGNRYSVAPELVEHQVVVRMRLGSGVVEVVAANGSVLAHHRSCPRRGRGAGPLGGPPCRPGDRGAQRLHHGTAVPAQGEPPPGPVARALAAALRQEGTEVNVDLSRYAELAEVAR